MQDCIDSHCHFDFPVFDKDRDEVVRHCERLGISHIVIPGTERHNWPQLEALCERYQACYYALGLHPYFLRSDSLTALGELESAIKKVPSKLVAIGETGLDAAIEVPISLQTESFEQHLFLAGKYNLPVIVHHRKSHHLIMEQLKLSSHEHCGVIHAFSGSYEQGMAYINAGFKLGIGGTITYERAKKTRDAVARLPLEEMLLETDAPDMPLSGQQGKPNSPINTVNVAKALARLKNISTEEVKAVTKQSTLELFSF